MKKNVILLLVTVFSVLGAVAQFKYGVKADANFFRINGDGMTQQFNAGVSVGFFAEYKIDKQWSIQPELLYSQRNTRAKDFEKYFSGSVSLTASNDAFLSYASLPVVVKYRIRPNWSVHAGVQYNYLVYADEDLLRDNKDAFKKNDIGAVAGADFSVSKRIELYGRFYYGLNDLNNVNNLHTWTAQQVQFGVAYAIRGYK